MALGTPKHTPNFSKRSAMDSRAGAKGRAYRTTQSMGMRNGANSHYLSSASQSYSRNRRSRGGDYSRGHMRANAYGRSNMMFGNKGGVLGQISRTVSGLAASWQSWLPVAGGIVAVIVLFLIISSGLRACSLPPEAVEAPEQTLQQAFGLSDMQGFNFSASSLDAGSLQVRADTKLNHDTLIAQVASEMTSATQREGLDEYDSAKGMALTSRTEQAAHFVAGLNEAHGDTQPFGGAVPTGTVPALYQWDECWGYMQYCGHPLGFTGCGVTIMAMARMGLTGATDMTPADMANLSIEEGEASEGTNSTFFYSEATAAATGVGGSYIGEPTSYGITSNLEAGSYLAVNVKENTLAGGGHWILVVGLNDDGTIEIRDPNSPEHTAQAWDIDEIVSYANAMVVLYKA